MYSVADAGYLYERLAEVLRVSAELADDRAERATSMGDAAGASAARADAQRVRAAGARADRAAADRLGGPVNHP
ncbi:hypothetical protein C8N24_3085 [Solirubrobacter pauli]|uniref:Uncharacterized protein n=1 Tax=Solirubrobacter pauli TaxID=166793 RepID=A0A660LJ47_9ACTN|nr:hypothetical protein [Solirubrobacter pauli]RKQ93224.1 hypothetical protein C8N24_3085 [Solirubrobacter pauli]